MINPEMSHFKKEKPNIKILDYEDEIFYGTLRKLPNEIAIRCLVRIETLEMDDTEALTFLSETLEKRIEVSTESHVSDEKAKHFFGGKEDEIYHHIETNVFTETSNHLGAGMTARIKKYELEKDGDVLPMAIKYVVTPKIQTLTASDEHDVIGEVERIQTIEKMENQFENRSKYIRVPHTYFHHKTDRIQCYGMELISGYDLKEIIQGRSTSQFAESIKKSHLADMSREELHDYIDKFFNTMHEFCLHGDIKPANIMLGEGGVFYVIDFGQSVLSNTETEKTSDQFDVLREDEISQTKTSISMALQAIFSDSDSI